MGNISEDAKNLIRMLLKMNPKDRYNAEQGLNHEWIKNKAPKSTEAALDKGFVDNLRGFRSQNKLKKAALQCIANSLDDTQIKALRETFMSLDGNGDGCLTVNEMKEGIKKSGMNEIPADLQQIMEDIDSDGSGVIDYTEFLAATLDRNVYIQQDVCWNAFRIFDKNSDGKISQDELKLVLGDEALKEKCDAKIIETLMGQCDTNGDGVIDFDEFMAMMKDDNKAKP